MTETGTSKEDHIEHSQILDAGAFKIPYLAPTPEGFSIVTRSSLRRREHIAQSPLDNSEQKETLRKQMEKDTQRAQAGADKIASGEGRIRTNRDYVNTMGALVGIRNINQEESILRFDTRPISFPVYSDLIRKEVESGDLINFGEATGTAAAILTKDGKLLVQYRGMGNRAYKNIPGASAAGLLRGEFNRELPGTVVELDADYITKNLKKEVEEELQVQENQVETSLIAVAHDEIKPHHEFLIIATIDLTSDELEERGLIPDDVEGHDFKERFFAIDGTPEAIEKLLTEVKCPLPPTHSAVFFMVGYNIVLEKSGKDEADKWAQRVSAEIRNNYDSIDKDVRDKYPQFPEKLRDHPTRSSIGYDPLYSPEEQGLPSLLGELLKTKLISEPMHKKLESKWMKNPQN